MVYLLVNSTNVSFSNTSSVESETSGIFVKTASAKSADLVIDSVYCVRNNPAGNSYASSLYSKFVNTEGRWVWTETLPSPPKKAGVDIKSGNVQLSNVYNNAGTHIIKIISGSAQSGDALHGSFMHDDWWTSPKGKLNVGNSITGNCYGSNLYTLKNSKVSLTRASVYSSKNVRVQRIGRSDGSHWAAAQTEKYWFPLYKTENEYKQIGKEYQSSVTKK